MPDVSTEEVHICERVCRIASRAGIRIREHSTIIGHCFEWKLKNGEQISGNIVPRNTWEIFGTVEARKLALVSACQALLPHLFTHV
jgi:hypothetical protein